MVEFRWHSGFSFRQKQRSVAELHSAARKVGIGTLLEISTKSPDSLGQMLSAFNLPTTLGTGRSTSVEVVYQASKVFEHGGPYLDLLAATSRDAKTDQRLRTSGRLLRFELAGQEWPLLPRTGFYDWLYISALSARLDLASHLVEFDGFTDIEFNPDVSLNCQARSAALFVSLTRRGLLSGALSGQDAFLEALYPSDAGAPETEQKAEPGSSTQGELFDHAPSESPRKRPT